MHKMLKMMKNAQNDEKLEFLKLLELKNSVPIAFKYASRARG